MISKIVEKIIESQKIALFHHINPDGDTLSSSYGLALALRKRFPEKEIVVVANRSQLEARFSFIEWDETIFKESIDETYLAIIGDTSAINRVDRNEEFKKANFKICFDHHKNTPDYNYDLTWLEPNWIASSLQAFTISKKLDVNFDENIAFHLAIGILTDSGNFVYSRGQAHPVAVFADLLDYISNEKMDHLYKSLKKRTKKDLEITKFILNNMQYEKNLVYLKVSKEDSNKFKGGKNLKYRVNQMGNIKGFDRWAIFVEMSEDFDTEKGIIAEFRSLGCDTSKIAIKYGGGGHIRASGCPPKSWEVVDQIIKELTELGSDE